VEQFAEALALAITEPPRYAMLSRHPVIPSQARLCKGLNRIAAVTRVSPQTMGMLRRDVTAKIPSRYLPASHSYFHVSPVPQGLLEIIFRLLLSSRYIELVTGWKE
jgi:hypothetical protein